MGGHDECVWVSGYVRVSGKQAAAKAEFKISHHASQLTLISVTMPCACACALAGTDVIRFTFGSDVGTSTLVAGTYRTGMLDIDS